MRFHFDDVRLRQDTIPAAIRVQHRHGDAIAIAGGTPREGELRSVWRPTRFY
jgi:hypothetical protein